MQGKKAKKTNRFLLILLFLSILSISFFNPILHADDKVHISFLPEINLPPYKPVDPTPKNNSTRQPLTVELKAFISDPNDQFLTVYFYNAITHKLIGIDIVPNGTYASTNWSGLQKNKRYWWYVVVNDSVYENTSDIWNFKTKNILSIPPQIEDINEPPVANITGPTFGYVNQNLTFFGNESYDPDGFIVNYRWDFNNDGLYDTDWREEYYFTYTYLEPGNYTVKLEVEDDDGATNFTYHNITIIEIPGDKELPIPRINGRYEGLVDQNISFSSEGSYDPDGEIIKYKWYFGDGNISYEPNPIHKYSKAGYYLVILKVWDDDNLSQTVWTTASIFEKSKEDKPIVELILPILGILVLIAIIITAFVSIILTYRHKEIDKVIEKLDKINKTKKPKKTKKRKNNKK